MINYLKWVELDVQLKGPEIELKTGRRDSKVSYSHLVEAFVPRHNESLVNVLSLFSSIGIDTEAAVALLGSSMSSNYTTFFFR